MLFNEPRCISGCRATSELEFEASPYEDMVINNDFNKIIPVEKDNENQRSKGQSRFLAISKIFSISCCS